MRRGNPRPVASFLEDDFDLYSLKRRKRPLKNLSRTRSESKLPELIKTVLPEATATPAKVTSHKEVRRTKNAQASRTPAVVIPRKRGNVLQNAGVFMLRWIVMPAVSVIICLLLYVTIDGFIEDLQNDRIRANSITYSQS